MLQDAHNKSIELAKAQLSADQNAIDNAHESLARVSEPVQLYAKRGAVYTRIEKVRLAPAEPIFIKHPGATGNFLEIIGQTDVDCLPPELPIIT